MKRREQVHIYISGYLVLYFNSVLRTSWYTICEVSAALIRFFCTVPIVILLELGTVNSYKAKKNVVGNWVREGEPWSHNITSQNRWQEFVQGRINDPDTQPVPLLITLQMPWNNSSTLSHCDDGELMRPPSFSSGYMQNSFRSIMASAKPHIPICEPDPLLRLLLGTDAISVAIIPQT